MTAPVLPDPAELFCTGCQHWKPRAQIVAVQWIRRGTGRQARYRCQTCQDARIRRTEKPRRGG